MSTAFAIGCIGSLVIGYSCGWRTRDRSITKRSADLRELRMMLCSHIEAVEFETIPRKAGAVC